MARHCHIILIAIAMWMAMLHFAVAGPIEDLVASAFPKFNANDLRKESANRQAAVLREMGEPTIFASLQTDDLRPLIEKQARQALLGQKLQLKSFRVVPELQLVRVSAEIEGDLDLPLFAITTVSIAIRAHLEGALAIDTGIDQNGLVLRLRPVYEQVIVDEVHFANPILAQFINGADIAKGLTGILTGFRDDLNARIGWTSYPVPISPLRLPGEPERSVPVDFAGQILAFPVPTLHGAAVLVDEGGLKLLVTLAPPPATPADVGTDPEGFRRGFTGRIQRVFGIDPGEQHATQLAMAPGFVEKLTANIVAPVTRESIVSDAVGYSRTALAKIGGPDLGLIIPASELIAQLRTAANGAADRLRADRGIVIDEMDFGLSEQTVTVTGRLSIPAKPTGIKGHFSASIVPYVDGLTLQLRPVIEDVVVDSISQAEPGLNLPQLSVFLSQVISEARGSINAVLAPYSIKIEAPQLQPIDLAGQHEAGVELWPPTYTPFPLTPSAITVLLDTQGLMVLSDLNAPDIDQRPTRLVDVGDATFVGYRNTFVKLFGDHLGSAPDRSTVFVARERLATVVNTAFVQMKLAGKATLPRDVSPIDETTFKLVDRPRYDCNMPVPCLRGECPRASCRNADEACTRDGCNRGGCTRTRSCSRDGCAWDCRHCVDFGWPLGRACADEPACAAGRAACNVREEGKVAACNIEAESEVADCNRREETAVAECNVREEAKVGGCRAEILACNAAAEALVGTCNTIAEAALAACKVAQAPLVELCEAAKLANNLLANIGDIGRIKGEVGATVKTDFTLADLRLRPDLSGMDGAFVVDGEANVDVTLDFQPLDVGHVLVCAFPGQATVKTRVSIPRQRVGISASSLVTTPLDDGTLAVDLMLDPDPVIAEIRPTPLQALFEQNPQLLVTCSAPVPAILAGLTAIGRATPNVLEAISAAIANPKVKALMLGEYIDDPKPTINRMKVGPITVEISGQKRQVFVRADEKSFRYEMAP